MFEYQTLHKMLLQREVLHEGVVVAGSPHEGRGKHHSQIVRSHLVPRAVLHHSVQVLAEVPEEMVVGLGEELEGVGEHLPVSLRVLDVLYESCRDNRDTAVGYVV